jgi:competence protein ComEA
MMHKRMALWTMVLALGLVLAFGAAATAAEGAKIDLNKATVEELTTLDRIGEVVAQRIVDYREQNGPFATIEDLKKVKGIGEKVFEANKDRITVSPPAGNK